MKEIERTLKWEGGWVNDENDPGGETNFGISKRQYPELDIKNLRREQAIEIYKRDYWDALGIDEIQYMRVRWKVFDIGVNMGVSAASRLLQKAVDVSPAGFIGPLTTRAVNALKEDDVMFRLVREQSMRYAGIVDAKPRMAKFIKGWIKRAFDTAEDLT